MHINEKYIQAIEHLVPEAQWVTRGDEFHWHDPRPMPSETQIEAAVQELQKAQLVRAVKAECKRRIYAQFSAEKQMNISTKAAHLGLRQAMGETLNAAELEALNSFDVMNVWIGRMRQRSNEMEEVLPLDPTLDEHWPAL